MASETPLENIEEYGDAAGRHHRLAGDRWAGAGDLREPSEGAIPLCDREALADGSDALLELADGVVLAPEFVESVVPVRRWPEEPETAKTLEACLRDIQHAEHAIRRNLLPGGHLSHDHGSIRGERGRVRAET